MLFCAFSITGLSAEVTAPPLGADAVPDLFAPNLAGPGGFSTTQGGAPASALNPAQGGDAQRIVFDVGYMGLAGFGNEKKYGNVIEGGMLIPTRFGVFGGSLRFLGSPFDGFPIKTTFGGNVFAAKEIYPGMSLGAGMNFGFGMGPEWTLSADLGFRYNVGSLGPLRNFTWAAVLRGMGKSWMPTWFTPVGGVSFDFFHIEGEGDKRDPLALSFAGDIGLPSIVYFPFTSMTAKIGLKAVIAELVTVSVSWPGASGLNARELSAGVPFQGIPSVGLGVDLMLPSGGKRIAGGRLPSDGDLAIDTAMKPLYNDIYAIGIGATWTVGVADNRPPLIEIDYPETAYFSPNNDGKADNLEVPLTITDARYVDSWVWEIQNENGEIIRTYRNKDLRPETQGVHNLIDRITAVKSGVDVPPVLRWDGIGDSGERAPDGKYFFTITASDDSGNTAATSVYEAVLDTVAPEITLREMSEPDKIFSPDGDGGKDTITFYPEGSEEEVWESGIWSQDTRIRSFENESGLPQARTWDGTNDEETVAPDGVYSYRISAVDRAQNSAAASIDNIIISTIQPQVHLFIGDSWFSPNDDGIKDTVLMDFQVPVTEGITGWTLSVTDTQGSLLRTIRGTADIPQRFEYDGKNDSGTVLAEDKYQAELAVHYRNGYVSSSLSPVFNLRVTPPKAAVRVEYSAFSPNNDGRQDEMILRQEGSDELVWTGDIRRVNGVPGERAVRSFRFTGVPPAQVAWDGHGDAGTVAVDGEYTYELYATDQAGNTGKSGQARFTLSTADTPVMISTDLRAFSPNGDRVKDSINLNPQIKERDGIVSYQADILNSAGQSIRTFEGQGAPPDAIAWDGRANDRTTAPDGSYTAKIELRYVQGNQPGATSLPFILDTQAPKAELSTAFTVFSPNDDGRRDTIPLSISAEGNDEWTAEIFDSRNQVVRAWNWTGQPPAIAWDGKDQAGNIAPDGTYRFALQSADEAGNSFEAGIPGISLDARVPRVILTASTAAIAPKENQSAEMARFNIICSVQDGIESWNLELHDSYGAVFRRYASTESARTPPASISWNGLAENGALREGSFTPVLTVNYAKGDVVTAYTSPIIVDVSGPALSFAYQPEYFSPDNDGVDDDLVISLGAQDVSQIASWSLEIREPQPPYLLFYRIEGKGSPAGRIGWDGRSGKGELVQSATDYPVTFQATDVLGNASTLEEKVGIDVLVIRDGDRLKIQVPSIIFRENFPDFNNLATDTVDNNVRVLRRIAEILNKFRDYRVQVEGHANPVLRTVAEEREQLQPLSEARARAVVNMLVEFGVNRGRLSSVGMGGTTPVVRYQDRDNWWKNRRVEFILIK